MASIHTDQISMYDDHHAGTQKEELKALKTDPEAHGDHNNIKGTPEIPPRDSRKRNAPQRAPTSETEDEEPPTTSPTRLGLTEPLDLHHQSPPSKRKRPQFIEEEDLNDGEITIALPELDEDFLLDEVGPCGDDGKQIDPRAHQSQHSSSDKENAAPSEVSEGPLLPLSDHSLPFSSPPNSPTIASLSGLSGEEIREFPSSALSSQTIYYGESSSEDDITSRRPSQLTSRGRNVRRSLIFHPDQGDYLSPSIWDIED